MEQSTRNLYILSSRDRKYYIGVTKNPSKRIFEHATKNGASWTKKYPPVEVIAIVSDVDEFDEDKYVKIYMSKYGIDNVRGGSYCTIKLPQYQIDSLNRELSTASGTCYKCGEKGHYVNTCDQFEETGYFQCVLNFIKSIFSVPKCSRCGRDSHTIEYCYARTHINGGNLGL